ncbi:MAG: SurA N-terminal domain-containing protein [Deltaproteobacteria bacterium]|jgi:peptidyl-prolyl cis-trans isomerase D|nr:SurA N-terminal domain-containing protein [Deltaproteobacteria bacterium]
MLDLLRKKAQSPFIQGTILIIALVFIFWGVGGYKGSPNSVAQVNDEVITYEEFQKAYERLANQYRDQFGGNLPKGLLENLDLEGQALEQLIQRSLLRQGASTMGIMVSDLEVQQAVEKMEAFRSDGIFNVELYRNILSGSGMTPASFEENMRTDLLAGKVVEHLSRFAKLTPLEVNDQFAFDNEQIKIQYVSFSGTDFKDTVETGEEQLQAYYEENKGNYMTEPQVKLQFLAFSYGNDEAAAIPEEDLEAFYRENLSRYANPEQRSARHILIKTSEEDSVDALAEKKDRAAKILELARTGEDFAELAKQYSEGPSGPKGGDLGFFSRGRMVKPFEDAVFSLNEGDISDLVETQFGFHIIKLEKIEPAHTKTLEEVKAEIAALIQEQKSRELSFTQATTAYENIILAGSLDRFSQENDIPVEQTDFFPRKSPAKSGSKISMASDPAFLNAAFSLNRGELSSLVETPQGYAIIFAADKKEPEIAPYEDVKEQVSKDYISAQSEAMAKEAAAGLLSALKQEGAGDFAAEAGKLDINPKTSDYIIRSDAGASALPEQIVSMAFDLTEENPYPEEAVATNGMYYVFRIMEKSPPSPELFSQKESEFRTTLLERKKSAILVSWLANVRDKAEIEINQQFL